MNIAKRYITPLAHGGNALNRPDTIVIHAMGEYIKDGAKTHHAVKFLDNYKLSAHALGAPDGSIYRCRDDLQQAWHARGHNRNSLGYEVLVPGDHDYASFLEAIKTPYMTEDQYSALLAQVREWVEMHPIRRIVRHCDISPGRKVDPGAGFPWLEFIADLGFSNDVRIAA